MNDPLTIKTPQGTFAAIPGDYIARDIRPPGPDLPVPAANPPTKQALLLFGIAALALLYFLKD